MFFLSFPLVTSRPGKHLPTIHQGIEALENIQDRLAQTASRLQFPVGSKKQKKLLETYSYIDKLYIHIYITFTRYYNIYLLYIKAYII